MTKQRVGKVGEIILLSVAAVGVVSIAVFAPNMLQILKPLLKDKKYSDKQSVDRNIQSLIKNGLIKQVTVGKGESVLRLTRKGEWEALIRQGKFNRGTKKWDGTWRVVIFDVPNAKGNIRGELRRAMKLYGFYQLQKSVWVYPFECEAFIALMKKYLGVSKDVLVMRVSNIENESHLRAEFKL